MPGKQYWKFQKSYGSFETLYEKGQSLKTSIDKMNKVFATKPLDDAFLLEGIRVHFPEYTITAQDREERASRRKISAMGRETFYKHLHQRCKAMEGLQPGETLERGVDMLLDLSDTPEAKAWNDRVCYLFGMKGKKYLNGTVDERSKLFMEFVDRQMKEIDFNKLYHMTDRELASDFVKLHSAFGLLAEGGDALLGLNNSVIKIPDEYVTKIKELKWAHQTQMGDMKGRFENIIDPNYEIIHQDRLRANVGVDADDFSENAPEGFEDRVKENPQARDYFEMMSNHNYLRWPSHFDKINNAIRELNLPEELLNPPAYKEDGSRAASTLLDVTTLDGKPLTDELMDDGLFLCFTNPITKQQHFLRSDGVNYQHFDFSHMPDSLKTDPAKALKELEAADPWRIRAFTGSKEYKEMKEAMKDMAEFMQRMPMSPTKEQREEYWTKVRDLEEKQEAYAKTKGELNESTKESERARINASNMVKKYIDDAYTLMGGYEKAVSVRAEMHKGMKEARDYDMEKQADKENRYEKARTITNEVPRYRQAQERTDAEKSMESHKVWEAYGKNLNDGDPLKDLGDDIHVSGYLGDNPNVLNTMAKMVTYDLIARERIGKSEAGTIEKWYLANKDAFIKGLESSQTLKNIAASVEKNGELKDFMATTVGAGVRNLADNVLGESNGQQVQKPETGLLAPGVAMAGAIQNQAVEPPKPSPEPPKPAPGPMGMG